ncbi:hypothetical protein RJT34_12164 [Clitoria ternatea]|uniref:Uncharacterized protein n=1 Tax=Clitoria ternatea TaxID=43366 RepID=A0AAN9JNY5_CLITE
MEQMSRVGSSFRRCSLGTSSSHISIQIDNDAESVSEAGDIGDRALPSRRYSDRSSFSLSFDNRSETGAVVSIQDVENLQLCPAIFHHNASVLPLPPQLTSPPSTNAIVAPKQEFGKGLPMFLDYASCLLHLSVFGILGVLTRYILQKLFGPGVAGVTSDKTILYLDLPSNMVGSFLMGWFGVVFKADISHVSEHLAIAITTGYLGSLTTYSGWNQKMVDLSVSGHWLFSAVGFLVGLFLVAFSIIFGVETAKGFRWLLNEMNRRAGIGSFKINWKMDSYSHQLAVMVLLLVLLGILWGVIGALVKAEFKHSDRDAQLWFACMVGPLGVWIRWFLARLNGRGLGRTGLLKWIPFGTLAANISAASFMAALASVNKAVNSKDSNTVVAGLQFGLMGCLSTVSTFAAEFNAMRKSNNSWRAYAYASITICVSYSIGILIYCVPVWTKGFDR